MNKYQEALDFIERNSCPYGKKKSCNKCDFRTVCNSFAKERFDILQELVDKSIPKKPDCYGNGYDKDGNEVLSEYNCPNCNAEYEVEFDKYDYCPKCGQAINWGEDEDS